MVSVAKPKSHGQAIMSTEIPNCKASSNSSIEGGIQKHSILNPRICVINKDIL
jgi:hypothetical protein